MKRRTLAAGAGLGALLLLAGCAGTGGVPAVDAQEHSHWSGRLSLRVDSEPPQSFSAFFDLQGNPDAGTLALSTPLGTTLAMLRWTPGEAVLDNGSQKQYFASVDALIEAATGAAIPVQGLFDWLAGRDSPVPGWRADLRQIRDGKLSAARESPQPVAELRIVFER